MPGEVLYTLRARWFRACLRTFAWVKDMAKRCAVDLFSPFPHTLGSGDRD